MLSITHITLIRFTYLFYGCSNWQRWLQITREDWLSPWNGHTSTPSATVRLLSAHFMTGVKQVIKFNKAFGSFFLFFFFFLDLAFCDLYFRWGTNLHLISRVEFVSIIFPVIVPLYALWPTRPQYYKVIEECVSQVVLHRSGMDPDFGYSRRLDVDFTHLIGNLS